MFIRGGVWVGALILGGWVPQKPSDPLPSYKRMLYAGTQGADQVTHFPIVSSRRNVDMDAK